MEWKRRQIGQFSSVLPETHERPAVWAGKTHEGFWITQFAYGQYGIGGRGKTRQGATGDLLLKWDNLGNPGRGK